MVEYQAFEAARQAEIDACAAFSVEAFRVASDAWETVGAFAQIYSRQSRMLSKLARN